MYIITNENALVCTGENKTLEWTEIFYFAFFEMKTETLENVLVWPGPHTHLETNLR